MRTARWLDHLPPWLGWGAIASTGAYAPGQMVVLALPLLAAALAEWRGWSLAAWRRRLELAALAALLLQLVLRVELLSMVMNTLAVLCAVRLCLPRGIPQRRQILLMGFLLFLTTAITTSELDFLIWSTAWVAGSAAVLLQLNWEKSAQLRRGALQAPPYARVLGWTAGALVLASGFFVILPRLHVGFSRLPAGNQAGNGARSGLSDVLDLGGGGPILASHEVALRILPATSLSQVQRQHYRETLGLLRGFTLEALYGRRWEINPLSPRRARLQWTGLGTFLPPVTADFYVSPALNGVIPLPYGAADLDLPAGSPTVRAGPGGSLVRTFQGQRAMALRIALTPDPLEPEPPLRGGRLALLTATGQGTPSARDWSLQAAPGAVAPRELAERLAGALRTRFRYTLDNPSGTAPDPLEDFLEHSHAGHCEYFASALALMLRYRGVPARVVNGYRLGPWIEEGGYFLVTQAEAHSWVEYYDPASGGWRVADPTPPAPPSAFADDTLLSALARWGDAVRFRWDRDVVRFSDEDQMAGASWAMDRMAALGRWRPGTGTGLLAGLALLGALAWFGLRRRPLLPGTLRARGGPGRIRELRPLVRRARRTLPPLEHETVRAWLGRMAGLRPHRAAQLERLAREADAAAYGRKPAGQLKALARDEARHWKR